jgi:p-hydroxybenzoate 3-monooxygenase
MEGEKESRTQVGIVGAGPAGLVLSHLLQRQGIESVVLEDRSREYVEKRVRAGVLEQGTVDLLTELGLADRLHREGLVHHGIELRFDGQGHRIAFEELADGRAITIYGQQEVVKDLIAARLDSGAPVLFEVDDVTLHGIESAEPSISFTHEGAQRVLRCDAIAGCDGFHGVSRPSIPDGVLTIKEREYPFAWLGILAEVAPSTEELIYAPHERGFALHSLRSPELSRLYVQCDPEDELEQWPDERIWEELHLRLERDDGWTLKDRAAAELRRGADAVRTPVPCGRRRPHRPGHRRQGPQPGGRRRPGPLRSADELPSGRGRVPARGVLRYLPAPGLARTALQLVDDLDAASVSE